MKILAKRLPFSQRKRESLEKPRILRKSAEAPVFLDGEHGEYAEIAGISLKIREFSNIS